MQKYSFSDRNVLPAYIQAIGKGDICLKIVQQFGMCAYLKYEQHIKKETCELKNPQVFITYANFRVFKALRLLIFNRL